ncbi:MAG: hypothetical protein AAFY14_10960 [Pseudomonadota bacterium]
MLGFIIAVAAGFFTPLIGGPLVDPLVKALGNHITIEADERPLVAFMLALLIAGTASAVLASGTPFWIILGGILGYFGSRIFDAAKKVMAERNAAD